MTTLAPFKIEDPELAWFIGILEGQRNAALTELARTAARVTVLEQMLQGQLAPSAETPESGQAQQGSLDS